MNSDDPKDANEADRKSSSDSFYSFTSETYQSYSEEDDDVASTSVQTRRSDPHRTVSLDARFRNPDFRARAKSLVTPTFRYDRQKPDNLFPPTKKFRYYPITCDYCGKRFQPNKLKAHQRSQHLVGPVDEVRPTRSVRSASTKREQEMKKTTTRSKSAGGIPRALQICYICGQLYGSKSLKIHEPKCLEKWRITNSQLPKGLRAPEPVKPEPMLLSSGGQVSGKDGYDVPAYDAQAEAAYRSHLKTLIPCPHCARTFSPDRIQKHMSCCIERPRTRSCVTPIGGEIPR